MPEINLSRIATSPAPLRLGYFLLNLSLLWLPFAVPLYLFMPDANLGSILALVVLYIEFIFLLRLWGKEVYQQPHILQNYGLIFSRRNGVDWLQGLAIGLILVFVLFSVEGWLGWLVWQQPSAIVLRQVVLSGIPTGIGFGFVEELLFRGWLLSELERDYSLSVAMWITTLIYAVAHFIKPLPDIINSLPQFFGLLLLGLILVWAKRRRKGRLGLSIGLHGGLVWGYYIIDVADLIKFTNVVPAWITGINNNPLAGMMGLVFLSGIAVWLRSGSKD